jgi:hypothetical protein
LLPVHHGPLLRSQPLLPCEIAPKLPALIGDVTGEVPRTYPTSNLAGRSHRRASPLTTAGTSTSTSALRECDTGSAESGTSHSRKNMYTGHRLTS